MPRKQRPWFRLYVEMMRDPKVRRLSHAGFRLWVGILAAARQSPRPGHLLVSETLAMTVEDIADFCGVSVKETRQQMELMEDHLGLVVRDDEDSPYRVCRWSERQFEVDDVTERTRKHRSQEQGRNVPTSSEGTPPEDRVQRTELKPISRASDSESDSSGIASDAASPSAGEDDHIEELKAKANEPLLGFAEFWEAYPKRNGRKIGKGQCENRWRKLSLEDRRAAWRGARNYASDVAGGLQIAKDPDRWLRDRLWTSFDGPPEAAPAKATVTTQEVPYDPEHDRRSA